MPSDALVDNLHDAVVRYCGLNYSTCDLQQPTNVHFTEKGCEFLGEHVMKSILEALRGYTYSKIGPGGCRTPEEGTPVVPPALAFKVCKNVSIYACSNSHIAHPSVIILVISIAHL